MTLAYEVFRPAYLLHELGHYVVALLVAENAEFGVTEEGRPWIDVEFDGDASAWRESVVGLAPVVSGGLFLAAYLHLVLAPLSGAGWYWLAPVHLYILGSAVIMATPSEEDLTPVTEWLSVR
jgi:hypothetical protein